MLDRLYILKNLDFIAYCDAAYADNIYTCYSTIGHMIFVARGLIYYISKKQTLVTLSTTKAEFINLILTACFLI